MRVNGPVHHGARSAYPRYLQISELTQSFPADYLTVIYEYVTGHINMILQKSILNTANYSRDVKIYSIKNTKI